MIGYRLFIVFVAIWLYTDTFASPIDPQVSYGEALFSSSGNHTTIHTTDNTVIDYGQFDIAYQESVTFIQPNSTARVLNRIHSCMPTQIEGNLSANGIVYFVNPAGIVISKDAVIDVGAFLAAAASISNDSFLSQKNHFETLSGNIVNKGRILAKENITLLGKQIDNSGNLQSMGNITCYTTQNKTICLGNSHEPLVVELPIEHNIEDLGIGSQDLFSLAIDNSGNMQAQTITLYAHEQDIKVSGSINAVNTVLMSDSKVYGGSISLFGKAVILNDAIIDVSGSNGGGTLCIGGKEGIVISDQVSIDMGSSIKANGMIAGDGGNVFLWANEVLAVQGHIEVKGGIDCGNGGYIETCSNGGFSCNSAALDVTAPHGKGGHWFIDPTNIVIVASGAGGVLADVITFPPLAGPDITFNASLINDFTGSTLTIAATNNIVISEGATITNATDGFTLNFYAANQILLGDNITLSKGSLKLDTLSTGNIHANKSTGDQTIAAKNITVTSEEFILDYDLILDMRNVFPTITIGGNLKGDSGAATVPSIQFTTENTSSPGTITIAGAVSNINAFTSAMGCTVLKGFTVQDVTFTGAGLVNLFGDVTVSSTNTFTNTGGVTLGGSTSDTFTFSAAVDTTTSTTTILQGTLEVAGNLSVAALILSDDTTITLDTNTFSATGSVDQSDTANLTITSTQAISFPSTCTVNDFTTTASSVSFGGNTAINGSISAANVTFGAGTVTLLGGGAITGSATFTTTGDITLNQSTNTTISFPGALSIASTNTTCQGVINTNGNVSMVNLILAGNTDFNTNSNAFALTGTVTYSASSNLKILTGSALNFPLSMTTNNFTTDAPSTTFNAATTINGVVAATSVTATGSGDISFLKGGSLLGTTTISTTGNIFIGNSASTSLSVASGLNMVSATNTTLQGSVTTAGAVAVQNLILGADIHI